jgi:hypothetical protein
MKKKYGIFVIAAILALLGWPACSQQTTPAAAVITTPPVTKAQPPGMAPSRTVPPGTRETAQPCGGAAAATGGTVRDFVFPPGSEKLYLLCVSDISRIVEHLT